MCFSHENPDGKLEEGRTSLRRFRLWQTRFSLFCAKLGSQEHVEVGCKFEQWLAHAPLFL